MSSTALLAASGLVASARTHQPGGRHSGTSYRHRRPFVAATASDSSSSGPAHAAAQQPQQVASAANSSAVQRRQLLALSLLAPAAALLSPAALPLPAAAEDGAAAPPARASSSTFYDEQDQFSITIPAGWAQGSGAIGEAGTLTSTQARFSNAAGLRRVVAFFPEGKPEVSVAITIQFLAPDFTGLGSFGTAQQFAQNVVTTMDTSYLLKVPEWARRKDGPVQIARLQDVREANKQFIFSYTVAKEGEPERTVFSSVAIGNNGRYNRLYTVNAACTATDVEQYGPVLKKIVDSFQPPPPISF